MEAIRGVAGIAAMLAIAWLLSERRRGVVWRPVWSGLLLSLALLAAVRWIPGAPAVLQAMNGVLDALQAATAAGTTFVFGHLGGGPLPYEPTAFDRYWLPGGTLLEEWVRKGIREVQISIPGSSKKLRCVVSLLQLGGGCGIDDPDMQDQEATARKAPDVPYKPELQEK